MKLPEKKLNVKLIAFDLDDTLLNKDTQISPANLAALQKAADKGIYIVLCSGRAENGILPFVRQIDRAGTQAGRYLIAFNGATIYDMHKREEIYADTVDPEILNLVYEEAKKRGMPSVVYDPSTIYSWIDTEWARMDAELCHLNFQVVEDFTSLFKQGRPKILVPSEPEKVKTLKDFLSEKLEGRADVFISKPFFLEVMTHGVGKGPAILHLAEHLGIPKEQTMGFGDSMNDETMIRLCGCSVAMCNGLDYIKDIATYITRYDNDHDGVADFLENYVL